MNRWFVFYGEGMVFGVGAKDGEIFFIGPQQKPCKPEWIGETLQGIKPYLKEKKFIVQELKATT